MKTAKKPKQAFAPNYKRVYSTTADTCECLSRQSPCKHIRFEQLKAQAKLLFNHHIDLAVAKGFTATQVRIDVLYLLALSELNLGYDTGDKKHRMNLSFLMSQIVRWERYNRTFKPGLDDHKVWDWEKAYKQGATSLN